MRTIKFRGKKPTNGLWAYGSLVASDELNATIYFQVGKGGVKQMEWVYVNPDTIGQYTGLKDKNGQEIYEGDILVQHGSNTHDVIGEVVYNEKVAMFLLCHQTFGHKHYDAFQQRKECGDEYYGRFVDCRTWKVIGNIHDNPELLKRQQQ